MGRRQAVPEPGGTIAYEKGKFPVVTGPGSACKEFRVRAHYQQDPDGFRGYGNTEVEARKDLETRVFGQSPPKPN